MKTKIGHKFACESLGNVTIYAIESFHTIVVVDSKGRYFRMSGLSLKLHS